MYNLLKKELSLRCGWMWLASAVFLVVGCWILVSGLSVAAPIPIPVPDEKPSDPPLCDGKPYDPKKQGCCNSKVIYDLKTQGCCDDKEVYDLVHKMCCNKKVVDLPAYYDEFPK